jgi:hypothetical protein
MKDISSFSIENNVIKDHAKRTVAVLSEEIGPDKVYSYAHVLAASAELFDFLEDVISKIFSRFDAFKPKSTGYSAYSDLSTHGNFPDWVKRGAQAIALAKGQAVRPNRHQMFSANLRPLFIENNLLKDDGGQVIAVLSEELNPGMMREYALLFAASVDLLDVVDSKSSKDLAEIEREYKSALQFNHHENLPPNVSQLAVTPLVLPDNLEAMLRLVAKAKGQHYRETD